MVITQEQIAELRRLYEQHSETLRQWQAKLAESPPPQTAGQRIAERMLRWDEVSEKMVVSDPEVPGKLFVKGSDGTADALRGTIARAIDKAVADDRAAADDINAAGIAAEREACAKVGDEFAREYASLYGCDEMAGGARAVAARIRQRK